MSVLVATADCHCSISSCSGVKEKVQCVIQLRGSLLAGCSPLISHLMPEQRGGQGGLPPTLPTQAINCWGICGRWNQSISTGFVCHSCSLFPNTCPPTQPALQPELHLTTDCLHINPIHSGISSVSAGTGYTSAETFPDRGTFLLAGSGSRKIFLFVSDLRRR